MPNFTKVSWKGYSQGSPVWRPEMKPSGNWSLLHDNASAHNATVVRQFLASRKVTVLHHPPYSPDMTPADYFLFPKLKSKLKGNAAR